MSKPGLLNIEKWNEATDGPLNEQNMENKLRKLGYEFTKYTFPPGMKFPDHSHGISKKDSILSGKFQISMYGQTVTLDEGDMIDVPKDTVHNAAVIGSSPAVFYDATKSPSFSATEDDY